VKKSHLVLLTFVPILVGYAINLMFFIPVIGILAFYILPLMVLAFWFWLGGQYAKTNWGMAKAVLIGSGTGILSLALYLWQFVMQSDETRNLPLAAFSQMYSSAAPGYFIARIAMLFESEPNYVGQATMTAMNILPLILMAAVFSAGFLWGRKHRAVEKK